MNNNVEESQGDNDTQSVNPETSKAIREALNNIIRQEVEKILREYKLID